MSALLPKADNRLKIACILVVRPVLINQRGTTIKHGTLFAVRKSMTTCPHCGAENAIDYRFCPKCGRPLREGDDATRLWTGARGEQPAVDVFAARGGPPHRTITVADLFATKNRLVIGRTPACDVCLPHPSVSRQHALLEKVPEGLRLSDLRSVNGVLVGGRRITEPVLIREHERVGIGPYLFTLADGIFHALDSSQGLRLEARGLEKTVALGRGRTRQLLHDVSLAVEPGEFVSLLGPSGSGKSTLMDCLNGRRPATRGQVLANGEDFYLHFNSFRQLLGYVPQRDIVHAQLTVYRALYYTARLRLPADTEPAELKTRVADVLRLMELEPHQDTQISNLSGGQVKRVSLGAELVARPALLYIDEATSGLDAGTEARMMRLFRQLSREGKSVFCITHNVDNVDLCDLILILAAGRLAYYGPPREGLAYFGVSRISDIYDRLGSKAPDDWEKEFRACSLHRTFVEERLRKTPDGSVLGPVPTPAPGTPATKLGRRADRPLRQLGHQFVVLTGRYIELLWRDSRTLRLLLLQAPVVGIIIFFSFLHKGFQYDILTARSLDAKERAFMKDVRERLQALDPKLRRESLQSVFEKLKLDPEQKRKGQELLARLPFARATVQDILDKTNLLKRTSMPVVPEKLIQDPTNTYILICLLVITILWFGCNNSAREIVKEEAIYSRERAVNLGITPYLGSKFLVLGGFSALQVLLAMVVIYGGLQLAQGIYPEDDVPSPLYRLDYLPQFGVLVMLSLTGVALGLLLSACVSSPDRASTLLPYVLIPQIVLCGGILPLDAEPLRTLALVASPAYWGYRAVRTGETELPPDFPWYADYDDNVWLACGALAAQTLVLLLVTAWFLRRKDLRRG
jgi:ABC-type multidrug transport system ATPase subunit